MSGLAEDTWYPLTELFDDGRRHLGGGFQVDASSRRFQAASIEMMSGNVRNRAPMHDPTEYESLQVSLLNVPVSDVSPSLEVAELKSRVVREALVLLGSHSYRYDLLLGTSLDEDPLFTCQGDLLVSLQLTDDGTSTSRDRRNREYVRQTTERGQMDEFVGSKAAFRLDNRSLLRKVNAVHQSGYLPENEFQIDISFSRWKVHGSADYTLTPLQYLQRESLYLRFVPNRKARGFQLTDLFR